MHAAEVKDFEQPVDLNHSLPVSVKPLGYFFLYLSSIFFTNSATETAMPNTKSLRDMKWRKITRDEMKA